MAFPRSKLRRRRYRFAVALVVTVLVVVVGHDITRAAHADPQSRTIQNTNFAAIANARAEERAARKHEREKVRRQTRKRPWGLKQRILDSKKKRSAVKKMRGKDW